jgi:hypothetical protein
MFAENGILNVSEGCINPKSIYLKSKDTGRPVQLIFGCGHRYDCMCPICADKWRRKNRQHFRDVMEPWDAKNIRMLTLTLRKDFKEQPVTDRIKELWEYRKELFRYLRDQGYWIGSWIACIELPNHMHIVMESDYIPHAKIKDKWLEITGDSFYVYINQWQNVRDMKRFSLYYLTKYLTKLGGVDYYAALQMKGFHLVGSNRGPHRKEGSEPVERERWIRIDRFEFEALYLDFYEYELPMSEIKKDSGPPSLMTSLYQWISNS